MDARVSWLRTAVTSIRTAMTAGALTLLVGFGAMSVLAAPQPPAEQLGLSVQDEATTKLLERNRCSTTGFAPDVVPASAIIREGDGRTRVVSFDHGWAVFKKDRPGELVAVCLSRPRSINAATR